MRKFWNREAPAAVAVFAAVLAASTPVSAAAEPRMPPEVYFGQGDRVYRFEPAAGRTSSASEPQRSGCVVDAVYRATGGAGEAATFEFGEGADANGLEHLGHDYAALRERVEHPEVLLGWAPVFTQELCLTDTDVIVTQRAGPDTVVWTIDRDLDSAELAVNGGSRHVSIAKLRRGETDDATEAWSSSRFVDFTGFHRAWYGYQWQLDRTIDLYEVPGAIGPMTDQCARPCFFCGLKATGTLVGGVAGIITTCNPGVVIGTAGTACAGVTGGLVLGLADTVASCVDCDRCLNPPKPECDDNKNCHEGYECCCEGEKCCLEGYEPTIAECES